jgi:hypothetical protein
LKVGDRLRHRDDGSAIQVGEVKHAGELSDAIEAAPNAKVLIENVESSFPDHSPALLRRAALYALTDPYRKDGDAAVRIYDLVRYLKW